MTNQELKPKQRRQQQTRRRILEAALDLIADEGVEAASLRKIAARSHYSPAAMYEYFDNKEDIITALCEEVDSLLADYLRQAEPNADPVGFLVEVGMRYIAFATENPKEYHLMQLRNPLKPSNDSKAGPDAFGILLEAVGDLETSLAPMDKFAFAYACWSFVHGLASLENQLKYAFELDFSATQRAALTRFITTGTTS